MHVSDDASNLLACGLLDKAGREAGFVDPAVRQMHFSYASMLP
jgi:hypothetical protein